MRRVATAVAGFAVLLGAAGDAAPTAAPQPVAAKVPVTDDYFGTRIVDPYRWMETRSDPRFVAWLQAEDAHARWVLAAIPGVEALQTRIAAHGGAADRVTGLQPAGGELFYLKRPAGEQTFKLYVRDGYGPERLMIDPDGFAGAGTHGAIDYFRPSPDGAKVAVSISTGGSENGVMHVVETASGKVLPDAIDRVQQGSPSWLPDGKGFFYNRSAAGLGRRARNREVFQQPRDAPPARHGRRRRHAADRDRGSRARRASPRSTIRSWRPSPARAGRWRRSFTGRPPPTTFTSRRSPTR